MIRLINNHQSPHTDMDMDLDINLDIDIDLELDHIENTFIASNEIIHAKCATRLPKIITSQEYYQNRNCMDSLKIPDLRNNIKHYKSQIQCKFYNNMRSYSKNDIKHLRGRVKEMYDFALIGTKQKLTDRIIRFFDQNRFAGHIQKYVRGHFVRRIRRLRGPAVFDRSICVNASDFYTLEPLPNIPFDNFFSYLGNGGFIYGFELSSILALSPHARYIKNPYTREVMDNIGTVIHTIVRLQKIIDAKPCDVQDLSMNDTRRRPTIIVPGVTRATPNRTADAAAQIVSRRLPRAPTPIQRNNITHQNSIANIISLVTGEGLDSIRLYQNNLSNVQEYNVEQMISRIREIRTKPLAHRAQTLFMEIDNLGHYTQPQWFMQLTRVEYIRYFRCLRDIWTYRAQLTLDIKLKICPLWDPFIAITLEPLNFNDFDDLQLQRMCISTMEDMVFTGLDNEFRMLGAFHVLSALTVVSVPARRSMMWLYESLVY